MVDLTQLWREKKRIMFFGSLFISYEINYGFYKENMKFTELNSFYCVQCLIWSEKLHLLELLMKLRSGKSIDSKTVRIGPIKCNLCNLESTCISLGLTPLLPISKYIKCVYKINPLYSIVSNQFIVLAHFNFVFDTNLFTWIIYTIYTYYFSID